jgi:hypothetical protein
MVECVNAQTHGLLLDTSLMDLCAKSCHTLPAGQSRTNQFSGIRAPVLHKEGKERAERTVKEGEPGGQF